MIVRFKAIAQKNLKKNKEYCHHLPFQHPLQSSSDIIRLKVGEIVCTYSSQLLDEEECGTDEILLLKNLIDLES